MSPLRKFPFHFILLLLFFLLHGYVEYIGLIPFTDMLVFFLTAGACGLVIFFLFKKIFHSGIKAGLLTTLLFLFYLFFGSIKHALFNTHYSILLPLMLVIVLLASFYFKSNSYTLTLFVNALLIIYILIDVVSIITTKKEKAIVASTIPVCDTCSKPDIYLIILDEYTGTNELQNYFHYNNHPFEEALRSRGFFVAKNPSSNYSATSVSVASLFSMDYLPEFHRQITVEDYSRAEKIIDQSAVMQFLEQSGYQFLNHSILNLRNQPGRFAKDLMPRRLRLITAKTLWNSMTKDLGWLSKLLPDDYKDGNQRLLELTRSAAAQTASKPRFIYTHLLLPHWPYLMDSAGNATNINFYTNNLSPAQKENAYIQYLAYTNGQMLQLMNAINRNSIIILMSDHAYRDRKVNGCAPLNNNFVSVYLPNRDYHLLHDSISNVNLFGSLFNTVFHTNIKQQRDSCIF